MLRIRLTFTLIFYLCLGNALLSGQNSAILDTLGGKLSVMVELAQAGNFEQAQVEVESLREFMKRNKIPLTARALTLMSGIYQANSDERSASTLLTVAEMDARRDPNPFTKAELLKALVQEYRNWQLPEQALVCQQLLTVAQDSIKSRERKAEALGMRQKYDSLATLHQLELSQQVNYIKIPKEDAWIYGSLVGLAFLILLWRNLSFTRRWQKLLRKKEQEWEAVKSSPAPEQRRHAIVPTPFTEEITAVSKTRVPEMVSSGPGPMPHQICLLIEPNRQVVLYLKSLLSDRFQIETAQTQSEALEMANEMLPDLIVCDALVNGHTGIEIARQIKLSERTNHIPVVLLTNKFGNEGKLDALRAGADAWFTRPVIDDEFDASVQRLIEARKLKHEQFSRFLQLYFTENRVDLQDPFLQQTVQLIESNMANPDFLPDDIARKLQLSRVHYAKKLMVLTGKEPVQLIREMRLEKAKVLLEKRAGTPQAISELVGFSNPGTFALAFKEHFGENTLLLYSKPSGRL
ncbi:MAG: response regulator transcription factor [Saprospiraceae bacterium]|nr:response regulator transcription factor [Saprospiraceae bacterium]